MPNTVVSINIKASKIGRAAWLLVYTGLSLACLLHPQSWVLLLLPFLWLLAFWQWRQDFGAAAPVLLERREGEWWLTHRNGQVRQLVMPLRWRSRYWLALRLPGGFTWLLWPDAVTPDEHRCLRRLLR